MLASASSNGTLCLTDLQSFLVPSDYTRLAQFAQALSSASLDPSGRLAWHDIPDLAGLHRSCATTGGVNRFCEWFFTSRTHRAITPFAATTVAEQVIDAAKQDQPSMIQWALLVAAGDPALLAQIRTNQH
jgi:hypothetical protein